jgi:hypothetical protein
VVAAAQSNWSTNYVRKARALDLKYNNTSDGDTGRVETRLAEYGRVLFPTAGWFNEGSRDLHDIITLATEDIAKKQFQSTVLPVKDYTELIGPIGWKIKQRLGMQLFRTGMALKCDRLQLCLGQANPDSTTRRQGYLYNSVAHTSIERIWHRWRQIHRQPVSARLW